jgi:hypothetical protein
MHVLEAHRARSLTCSGCAFGLSLIFGFEQNAEHLLDVDDQACLISR